MSGKTAKHASDPFHVAPFEAWREQAWQELCGVPARPTSHTNDVSLRSHLLTTDLHNQLRVRQAYRDLLGREADPNIHEAYPVVRRNLRGSPEYLLRAATNYTRLHLLTTGRWPTREVRVCRGGDVPRQPTSRPQTILPNIAHVTSEGVVAQSWRDAGFDVRVYSIYEQRAFLRKHGLTNFAAGIVYFKGGWFVDGHFCATPPDPMLTFVNAGVIAGCAQDKRVAQLMQKADHFTELPKGIFAPRT